MNPRIEWILRRPAYQRALMLLVLVALVAVAFFFLLYQPLQEEYSQLQKRRDSLAAKLREDQSIAADLPRFKAEYEKMQQQLEQALTELPNEKEIPTLLTTIASLAKDNGLDVLRFKPGGEKPQGFYARVPVDLKLVGSYHQVARFFYDVGHLPRIVNLSDVTLGSPKSGEGGTVLSVDCLATTFRFLENSGNGKKGKR